MSDDRSESAAQLLEHPNAGLDAADGPRKRNSIPIAGIVLGRLVALLDASTALVTLNGRESDPPIVARRLAGLQLEHLGREVALILEDGDVGRVTIIALIELPSSVPASASLDVAPLHINADSIVFNGTREIVLHCGNSSITLTKSGKVLIRGEYLLSRSSGVNRIKGGSVQIN